LVGICVAYYHSGVCGGISKPVRVVYAMKYSEKVFHAVVLSVTVGFYSALAFAERYPYGSTWQVKCEQSADGRDAQCWLVEVPNEPIEGIDIPFSKGSNEKD